MCVNSLIVVSSDEHCAAMEFTESEFILGFTIAGIAILAVIENSDMYAVLMQKNWFKGTNSKVGEATSITPYSVLHPLLIVVGVCLAAVGWHEEAKHASAHSDLSSHDLAIMSAVGWAGYGVIHMANVIVHHHVQLPAGGTVDKFADSVMAAKYIVLFFDAISVVLIGTIAWYGHGTKDHLLVLFGIAFTFIGDITMVLQVLQDKTSRKIGNVLHMLGLCLLITAVLKLP